MSETAKVIKLPKPKRMKKKIVCSVFEWKNMDREEKIKKECIERNKSFFNSGHKPKPKKLRPKISKLTTRIYSEIVLQNA